MACTMQHRRGHNTFAVSLKWPKFWMRGAVSCRRRATSQARQSMKVDGRTGERVTLRQDKVAPKLGQVNAIEMYVYVNVCLWVYVCVCEHEISLAAGNLDIIFTRFIERSLFVCVHIFIIAMTALVSSCFCCSTMMALQ